MKRIEEGDKQFLTENVSDEYLCKIVSGSNEAESEEEEEEFQLPLVLKTKLRTEFLLQAEKKPRFFGFCKRSKNQQESNRIRRSGFLIILNPLEVANKTPYIFIRGFFFFFGFFVNFSKEVSFLFISDILRK